MKKLQFEKIGDINSTYPYLFVYFIGDANPFMEIAVSEIRALAFNIYPSSVGLTLCSQQWEEIFSRAQDFLPRALADEDAFQRHMRELAE